MKQQAVKITMARLPSISTCVCTYKLGLATKQQQPHSLRAVVGRSLKLVVIDADGLDKTEPGI